MRWLFVLLLAAFKSKTCLAVENLCLRQQLAVAMKKQKRPRLRDGDRQFWILLSRWFPYWREWLVILRPDTVLAWHRQGWLAYWRWKSRKRQAGRRRISLERRQLIRRMAQDNPLWGQVRIMAELLKLGYTVSPRTARKYMRRPWNGPPSPRWKDFLRQHAKDIWACDFLTVRTPTFQTLCVFFLIHHASREVVPIRVTRHPTSAWAGQQLVNACFERTPPTYLIRDRDNIYGHEFGRKARAVGIQEIRTPIRAPQANGIAERFVGTLRRECLDHMFIFNERHLQKIVTEFAGYYNRHRPHRSLDHRPPCSVSVATGPPHGSVIAEPVLGGLHHVYHRAA